MKLTIATFSFCLIIAFNSNTSSAQGIVRDYDGNEYKTTQIKDQTWMAENLRSIHDAQGKKIKRHCYLLIRENCEKYGGLYATIFGIQYGGNYHYRLKNYNYLNDIAYYWTSTPFSHTASWMRMIGRLNVNSNRSTVPNVYGLSIRCLKD